MEKHVTRLLIVCHLISMIISGCSISSNKPNDKSNLSKYFEVNITKKISFLKINDTEKERILNIDNKEDLLIFINAINTSKIIENQASELKKPRYIVNIYYDGNNAEEYYLYIGKDQGHLIGNGNDNAYDLTYKSVLEINKLIERYSKK